MPARLASGSRAANSTWVRSTGHHTRRNEEEIEKMKLKKKYTQNERRNNACAKKRSLGWTWTSTIYNVNIAKRVYHLCMLEHQRYYTWYFCRMDFSVIHVMTVGIWSIVSNRHPASWNMLLLCPTFGKVHWIYICYVIGLWSYSYFD